MNKESTSLIYHKGQVFLPHLQNYIFFLPELIKLVQTYSHSGFDPVLTLT
jgi:hypothetical protein